MSCNCYKVTGKLFLIFCGVLIWSQSVLASGSGVLKGRVYDKDTRERLPGATIMVRGTSIGASTDINGSYSIYNAPTGELTIVVSYVGYVPLTSQVVVGEGQQVEQDFYLTAQAVTTGNVVVTAQAVGQMQSINQQLAANQIVNIVSAEKMKELPDANIAESIGRLPGISLQRNAGEANAVVIRGLSPKYNIIEIQGIPMSSTYYGDRGVDLSLLGDDLVKGVEVSKTLRADMDADALGGTVNLTLRTADPGFHYDIWANGGYNGLRDSYNNYKFTASAGNRFFNNKIGVLIQGNLEQKPLPSDNFTATYSSAQLSSIDRKTLYVNTLSAVVTDNNLERQRFGLSLILDYTSDLVDVKLFNVYQQKNDSTVTRQNESNFGSRNFEDYLFINQSKTIQETHSLQALFKFAGTELPVSVAWTKGEQQTPNAKEIDFYEMGVQSTPTGAAVTYAQPLSLIRAMGVLDPTNTTNYTSLYNMQNSNSRLTDNSYDAKIDWKIPLTFSESISGRLSVGGKYHFVDRGNSNSREYIYMWYGNGAGNRKIIDTAAAVVALFPDLTKIPVTATSNLQSGLYAFPFVDNSYGRTSILGYPIGPSWSIYKLVQAEDILLNMPDVSIWQDGPSSYNQNYTYNEEARAGYVMFELNLGNDLTVVPGVRYQEEMTNISAYHVRLNGSNANGLDGPAPVWVETKRDNPGWYPSVNIKYRATDFLQVIAAAYRSVSLPNFSDITPQVSLDDGGYLNNSGNPLLQPAKAWNYDLGISAYSNTIGLFTVDLFYKQISDLIYGLQGFYPFYPYPIVGAPADLASRLPGKSYYDTTWYSGSRSRTLINGSIPINDPADAYLRGIEFSWQTHFWYLPGLLSGLILDFNFSLMSSNQEYPYFKPHTNRFGTVDTLIYSTTSGALQDQPKAIYNVIVGWDYMGFSARYSVRYQQLTLTSMDTQYGLKNSYYDNVLLMDISLKQQLIGNLSLFANATNINNHVDNYYFSHPAYAPSATQTYAAGNLPTSQQTYGWALQFGLTYNY